MGFLRSYVTEEGRAALRRYTYSGKDLSLLYKHVLSPWADFCVARFTPLDVAPNTITLFGLCFQAAAFLLAFALAPSFGAIPDSYITVSSLCAASAMFIYSSLDNMDGKQARRTGASSPLGLLFDHGCDAINAALIGWAVFGLHTTGAAYVSGTSTGGAGGLWTTFGLWLVPTLAFFFNTWEEFHIGILILPIVNGANEGLLTAISLLLLTAVNGTAFWANAHTLVPFAAWAVTPAVDFFRWALGGSGAVGNVYDASATDDASASYFSTWLSHYGKGAEGAARPVLNVELVVTITLLLALLTALSQIINVVYTKAVKEGNSREAVSAMVRQLPLCLLVAGMVGWTRVPACAAVVAPHWAFFFGTAGFLFVDMTCKLMVSHVCDQEYVPFYPPIVFFCLAPLILSLGVLPAAGEGESVVIDPATFASFALLLSFALASLTTSAFLLDSVRELADALDIDIFDITKQVQRKQLQLQKEAQQKALAAPQATAPAAAAAGGPGSRRGSKSEAGNAPRAAKVGDVEVEDDASAPAPTRKRRSGSASPSAKAR